MKICTMSENGCDHGHSECCCECQAVEKCDTRCTAIESGANGECGFLKVLGERS